MSLNSAPRTGIVSTSAVICLVGKFLNSISQHGLSERKTSFRCLVRCEVCNVWWSVRWRQIHSSLRHTQHNCLHEWFHWISLHHLDRHHSHPYLYGVRTLQHHWCPIYHRWYMTRTNSQNQNQNQIRIANHVTCMSFLLSPPCRADLTFLLLFSWTRLFLGHCIIVGFSPSDSVLFFFLSSAFVFFLCGGLLSFFFTKLRPQHSPPCSRPHWSHFWSSKEKAADSPRSLPWTLRPEGRAGLYSLTKATGKFSIHRRTLFRKVRIISTWVCGSKPSRNLNHTR